MKSINSNNQIVTLSAEEKQRIILEKKALSLEKSNQEALWRKIVVKVISWTDGLVSGGIVKKDDKITEKEWQLYYSRTIQINVNRDKDKVEQDLEDTKKKIASFGGFDFN